MRMKKIYEKKMRKNPLKNDPAVGVVAVVAALVAVVVEVWVVLNVVNFDL